MTSLFHFMLISLQLVYLCCLALGKHCIATIACQRSPSIIFNIASQKDKLTYRAMSVFPVPGGPNRRIPRGGYKMTKYLQF